MPSTVVELSRDAQHQLRKAPLQVRSKFAGWARACAMDGILEVRKRPGWHDEPLRGARKGQRSVRLSLQWRAIYIEVERSTLLVAIEVTPHKY